MCSSRMFTSHWIAEQHMTGGHRRILNSSSIFVRTVGWWKHYESSFWYVHYTNTGYERYEDWAKFLLVLYV